jgi:cell wall-associated NlpC family hydrolase
MPRPRLLAAVAAIALVTTAAVIPASADSISDKQRQAQQIADNIEQLGDTAAALGEQYDGAIEKLQKADADVGAAQAKLDDLERKLGSIRSAAGAFAVKAYIYADQTTGIAAMLSGSSVADGSAQREGYDIVALGNTSTVTDDMKALIEDTNRQKADLDAKRATQAQLAAYTQQRQKAALAAQAKQQQVLVKVKSDLATLVQQEQQRRAAEAARQDAIAKQQAQATLAAAQNRTAASATVQAGSGAAGAAESAAPSMSAGAGAAVRAALSQLGVPYRFAAASPGQAFDCSGLTMWAWAQAGVSLPHFAASQYAMLSHVPLSDLQPGDLVFFYRDLHHVGIYIGNGNYVQAPRTGDVVKVSPLAGRDLVGAARP